MSGMQGEELICPDCGDEFAASEARRCDACDRAFCSADCRQWHVDCPELRRRAGGSL